MPKQGLFIELGDKRRAKLREYLARVNLAYAVADRPRLTQTDAVKQAIDNMMGENRPFKKA